MNRLVLFIAIAVLGGCAGQRIDPERSIVIKIREPYVVHHGKHTEPTKQFDDSEVFRGPRVQVDPVRVAEAVKPAHDDQRHGESMPHFLKEFGKDLADDFLKEIFRISLTTGVAPTWVVYPTRIYVSVSSDHGKLYYFPDFGFNRFPTDARIAAILSSEQVLIEFITSGNYKIYQRFWYHPGMFSGHLDIAFDADGTLKVNGQTLEPARDSP